jgi:hypothetical protein
MAGTDLVNVSNLLNRKIWKHFDAAKAIHYSWQSHHDSRGDNIHYPTSLLLLPVFSLTPDPRSTPLIVSDISPIQKRYIYLCSHHILASFTIPSRI